MWADLIMVFRSKYKKKLYDKGGIFLISIIVSDTGIFILIGSVSIFKAGTLKDLVEIQTVDTKLILNFFKNKLEFHC